MTEFRGEEENQKKNIAAFGFQQYS